MKMFEQLQLDREIKIVHLRQWKCRLACIIVVHALLGFCFIPDSAADFIQSYNYPDHYMRHQNSLGEITVISSPGDVDDASFNVVRGLDGGKSVSFEAKRHPGFYLRHQGFRIKLQRYDGTSLFKKDASFKVVPGLANASWKSFEAINFPGYFIRHKGFSLYLEKSQGDLFRKDATFQIVDRAQQKGSGGGRQAFEVGAIQQGIGHVGMDIEIFNPTNQKAKWCQKKCIANPNCGSWSWGKLPGSTKPGCWLKSGTPNPVPDRNFVSGFVFGKGRANKELLPKQVTISTVLRSDNGCKTDPVSLTIPAGRTVTSIRTSINPNGFLPCYGAHPAEKVGYIVKSSSGAIVWKETVFWKGGEEGGPPKTLPPGNYQARMVSFGRNAEVFIWVTYE